MRQGHLRNESWEHEKWVMRIWEMLESRLVQATGRTASAGRNEVRAAGAPGRRPGRPAHTGRRPGWLCERKGPQRPPEPNGADGRRPSNPGAERLSTLAVPDLHDNPDDDWCSTHGNPRSQSLIFMGIEARGLWFQEKPGSPISWKSRPAALDFHGNPGSRPLNSRKARKIDRWIPEMVHLMPENGSPGRWRSQN